MRLLEAWQCWQRVVISAIPVEYRVGRLMVRELEEDARLLQ